MFFDKSHKRFALFGSDYRKHLNFVARFSVDVDIIIVFAVVTVELVGKHFFAVERDNRQARAFYRKGLSFSLAEALEIEASPAERSV